MVAVVKFLLKCAEKIPKEIDLPDADSIDSDFEDLGIEKPDSAYVCRLIDPLPLDWQSKSTGNTRFNPPTLDTNQNFLFLRDCYGLTFNTAMVCDHGDLSSCEHRMDESQATDELITSYNSYLKVKIQ